MLWNRTRVGLEPPPMLEGMGLLDGMGLPLMLERVGPPPTLPKASGIAPLPCPPLLLHLDAISERPKGLPPMLERMRPPHGPMLEGSGTAPPLLLLLRRRDAIPERPPLSCRLSPRGVAGALRLYEDGK